ncbi:unnamed protein product [Schistosoma haematobium]|nr:unnamed protein product [Schistosoma haematobium]
MLNSTSCLIIIELFHSISSRSTPGERVRMLLGLSAWSSFLIMIIPGCYRKIHMNINNHRNNSRNVHESNLKEKEYLDTFAVEVTIPPTLKDLALNYLL